MKKILLLGGSTKKTLLIQYAKSQGYYTILCNNFYTPRVKGYRFIDETK